MGKHQSSQLQSSSFQERNCLKQWKEASLWKKNFWLRLLARNAADIMNTMRSADVDMSTITITIMTLAAANTLGMEVSLPAAILLSIMSALGACGASGVAGGSLLLIPMACSLFGISNDIAMQVVGVGFIIGVIQDSVETALNSAGDVEFAATAEYHQWLKEGKPLPDFMA